MYVYALVPDRGCVFYPILETSDSGKSKGWKSEELTLLCDIFALGGHRGFEYACASVLVLHRTRSIHLRFTNYINDYSNIYDDRFAVAFAFDKRKTASAGRKQNWIAGVREGVIATAFNLENTA
ncbi:hypothetical protein EVAR_90035_1 [Eumeta japonica]|uniref:Uncharacterized protein n=1 Tax=Eumeta variegata TaxID=151549 RepID=A0A4C1WVU3_EUMVA|nr:hypothetical protein EVAR_90035_1 [Eumeta japonica]